MKRLRATLAVDMRLQFRNGFYAATVLVMVISSVLLRWLPRDAAILIFPMVIISNVLVNTFYFVSGLLLLERVEGAALAQRVTPLRTDEYLGAKLITLSVLSLFEGLLVALAVFGTDLSLLPMAAGILLAAVLCCLAGTIMVVRYESINEFLLPSLPVACLLSLPVLGVLGVGPQHWYLAHPIQGPLTLMQIAAAHTSGQVVYGLTYPLLWIILLYLWSRAVLHRARST